MFHLLLLRHLGGFSHTIRHIHNNRSNLLYFKYKYMETDNVPFRSTARKIQIHQASLTEGKINVKSIGAQIKYKFLIFYTIGYMRKGGKYVKRVPCVGGTLARAQEEKRGPAPRWVALRFHTCRKSQ